ncbi:U32 family peptidase [Aneurinibacillus sp. Ricciae_BoGa-3]|uniref:peptidase U32 family protein n=1 Tax=Aneurinibacillus sp. Ricciae_BoGa-3 TaxID=3022697 RepID=UPI00234064D3|nr:peptidase U32 family protein [Aneurinibacillus sp. Ricciae_BoGa-3]WCK53585.1 U32 family peptidase [Aneurinibacillus sp. Ricciae_BoGa-3]
MKKTELLCTAGSFDEVKKVIEAGADAINIGNERFGLRLPGNFSLDEIRQAVAYAHQHNVRVYVSVNKIFHNDDLHELPGYIKALAEANVDAVVYGDPAVLMTVRQVAPNLKLHWNAETLTTNVETINYWGRKGAVRAYLARELNMDAILEIKEQADVEIQVQVQGMTCIFHSRRDLVSNYREIQGADDREFGLKRGMSITEEKRQDLHYPIYEDHNGTHIMSAEDTCILENLDELLDAEIDSVKIESVMKNAEYNARMVSVYRRAIDAYYETPETFSDKATKLMLEIHSFHPQDRALTTGFFFKEQVY